MTHRLVDGAPRHRRYGLRSSCPRWRTFRVNRSMFVQRRGVERDLGNIDVVLAQSGSEPIVDVGQGFQ